MHETIKLQKCGLAAAAALCAALCLPASAQQQQPQVTTPAPMSGAYPMNATASGAQSAKRVADRKFMTKAAAGGIAEVEMGKLAQQKASDDRVKQFGARMETDHTKANDELKSIASSKGVELPTAPDKKAQKTMDQLNGKSGADFDRSYMTHMVADHKKDIALFEKEANSGKDAATRAFANKTLPTLREHLQMAQDIHGSMKGGSGKSARQ